MNKEFKPAGYNSVAPYFIVDRAQELIELLQGIFDARLLRKYDAPDGTIVHAEVQIDDSVVMLADANEKYPPYSVVLHVYVQEVDEIFNKAISMGCEEIDKPKERNADDPDRRGTFRDPFGNLWSVATQKGN